MSEELDRGFPGKFDSRTLNRETPNRGIGHMVTRAAPTFWRIDQDARFRPNGPAASRAQDGSYIYIYIYIYICIYSITIMNIYIYDTYIQIQYRI